MSSIRVGWPQASHACIFPTLDGTDDRRGRLSLLVVPGSSRDTIIGWLGDLLKVKMEVPPDKGRADEAVVALLAERLGIDASSIAVVSGHSPPEKVVEVDGMNVAGGLGGVFPRKAQEKRRHRAPGIGQLPIRPVDSQCLVE